MDAYSLLHTASGDIINSTRKKKLYSVTKPSTWDWIQLLSLNCMHLAQQTVLHMLPHECIWQTRCTQWVLYEYWNFTIRKNKLYILKLDKYNARLFIQIIRQLILSTYFLYQYPKNIQRTIRISPILFLETHFSSFELRN